MLFRPGISSVLLLLVQDCCYPLIADSRAAEGLLNQEASQEACASSDEATNLLVHKAALPRMNEDELEGFDGTNGSRPILLALSNVVYDISSEPGLYGPGGRATSGHELDRSQRSKPHSQIRFIHSHQIILSIDDSVCQEHTRFLLAEHAAAESRSPRFSSRTLAMTW